MEISDVRVKLIHDSADRLKAVCTVTFDGEFVVRDVKVVDGTNGLFVAMPSRKLSVHCPKCRHKNHLRSRFCNDCGARLPAGAAPAEGDGRSRMHRDIAHPITTAFREQLQARVIEAFYAEREEAQDPNYVPADIEEVQEVAEQEEPDSIMQPSGEMTEYDSIIAGLRGGNRAPQAEFGSDESRSRGRDRERDRFPSPQGESDRGRGAARPSQPARGGRGDSPSGERGRDFRPSTGRTDRDTGNSRGFGRPPERAPMERVEPNERRETSENLAAHVPSPRREPERPTERRSFEVPQERTERAAEPPRPQPTFTAKPAPSPKPAPPVDEEEGGFGAGLL